MAESTRKRTRKPGRNLEVSPGESPGEAPEEAGGEGSTSLFNASGDSRVRVYRMDERSRKMVFHGNFGPDVDEAEISQAFGGGTYRCQLTIVNGVGKQVIKSQRDIIIPGTYKPPTDVPNGTAVAVPAKPGTSPVISAQPQGGSQLDLLNSALTGSVIELLKSLRTPVQPPQSAMTPEVLIAMMNKQSEQQTAMMTMMMTMFSNMNKGDSKKEVLEMLSELKALTGGVNPTNPSDMMGSIVNAIKQLREISDDISPDKDAGDPMNILGKLADVVVAEQRNRPRRIQRPAQPGQQQPAAITQGDGTMAPKPKPVMPGWQMILRREGARLLSEAQADRDPGLVANMALEYAPPNVKPHLMNFFKNEPDDIKQKMVANIPGIEAHDEWLDEFIYEARVALGFEVESDDEGQSGDDIITGGGAAGEGEGEGDGEPGAGGGGE